MGGVKPAGPIQSVVAGGLCIGCGACTLLSPDVDVSLSISSAGFIEPSVDRGTLDVGDVAVFREVCPGSRVQGPRDRGSPLWGPILSTLVGHSNDHDLRFSASSGGVLTALCRHLLDSGTVDAVVTLAPEPAHPLRPRGLVARSSPELEGSEGSRYCPSSPVVALSETRPGERVAFVGKPCDVAAVRQIDGRVPRLSGRVTVAISFFCAGIPSFEGTDELVRTLGHEPAAVTRFRYRGAGWPGRATSSMNDDVRSMSYGEAWGGILTRYRHERCKICPDGTGELADIVCGDAWEVVGGAPSFDEAPGQSLILARTALGAAIVDAAGAKGAITTAPYDIDLIAKIQPSQALRKRSVAARLLGRRLMGARAPRYRRLGLLRSSRGAGWRSLLSETKGSAWRARRDHPRGWHRLLGRSSQTAADGMPAIGDE